MIVYLAAEGKTNAEIAMVLNITSDTVRLKLGTEQMQFAVKHMRYKLYGKDHKKRFEEILPHAIDVTEEILLDPNAKQATRFAAAQEVMDRTLGKPKQTVEHEGSIVRALFEKLDEKKTVQPIIDVGVPELLENPNNEPVIQKYANPNLSSDPVEDWVKKNL